MKRRMPAHRSGGFTIVEVMVALAVIAVGLLGIAKMQALALSSTNSSRLRSIAAIEAASLASAMHADRGYWAGATLTQPIVINSATPTTSDAALTTALTAVGTAGYDYCIAGRTPACTPVLMAANDLRGWTNELRTVLPNPTATITCPTTSTPLTCTIQITWSETAVGLSQQVVDSTSAGADFLNPTYILYVQP